jgi:hypothetical protein
MTIRSTAFSVLLLSADPELHAQIKRTLKDATVIVAKDVASVPRAAVKRGFDAVLVEATRGVHHDLAEIPRLVEPSRAVILVGSRAVLRHAAECVHAMTDGSGRLLIRARHTLDLEDFGKQTPKG